MKEFKTHIPISEIERSEGYMEQGSAHRWWKGGYQVQNRVPYSIRNNIAAPCEQHSVGVSHDSSIPCRSQNMKERITTTL